MVDEPHVEDGVDRRWPDVPPEAWRGTRPATAFPVPFSVVDGFVLAVWSVLGAALLAQIALQLWAATTGVTRLTDGAALGLTVGGQLLAAGVALVYLRSRGALSWRLLGPRPPRWMSVLAGLALGAVGFLGVQLSIGLIVERTGAVDSPDQSLVRVFRDGGTTAAVVVLVAVVLAPLIEEFVFRGVLFQALREATGLWPAAIISGLVFGIVHIEIVTLDALPAVGVAVAVFSVALLPPVPLVFRVALATLGFAALGWTVVVLAVGPVVYTLGLSALGVLLAWGFHRTGTLLVPVLGHVAFNGISLVLLLVGSS